MHEICDVLANSTRILYSKIDDLWGRSKRPAISAGALHPIEPLLVVGNRRKRIFHYDTRRRSLFSLKIKDPKSLDEGWRTASQIVPSAVSALIVLAGRPQLVSGNYENADSLLWRDAGAILQTLSMTAMAFDLGTCPLGFLGQQMIDSVGSLNEPMTAVGTLWIGRIKQI
jgi:hypothetical protein